MKLNKINYKLMTLLGMATLITACGTTGTYIGYSNTGDLPSDYIQPSKSVIKAKNPATNESQVMYLTQESVDQLNSNQETELKFFFTEHKPNEDSQPDLTIQFNPNTDNFDPTANGKDNSYALKFDKESSNLYGIVQDENGKLHALGATSIPASDGAMAQNFEKGVEATYSVDAIALMDKEKGLEKAQSGTGKFTFTFDSIVEGGTGAFEGDITLADNTQLKIDNGKIHDGAFESTIKGDGKTANLDGIFTGKEAEGITGGWEGDEMLGAFSGKRD